MTGTPLTSPVNYNETLNVSPWINNTKLNFTTRRDRIVDAIKRTDWYIDADEYGWLHDAVFDLSASTNTEEFTHYWAEILDLADEDNIRILER